MRALTEASEDIAKPEDVFQNCGDLVNLLMIILEPHVNEDGEIIPIGMLVGYELISNDYGVHGLPGYGLHVLFVLSHLHVVCKCAPYFISNVYMFACIFEFFNITSRSNVTDCMRIIKQHGLKDYGLFLAS